MKDMNIAAVLVQKRKQKGITQDELASYIGVTKASVSKWETGQSYPDITFLPILAAYFNISIDELMDYQPQMTKGDIRKLYLRLSADFAAKPIAAVMEDCRRIVKKYYACFPLLLQMGTLMVNHMELIQEREKALALLEEARALFIRVKEESGEVSLTKQALYMEALCSLAAGDPNTALALLESAVTPALPPEAILASAYQMTGRAEEAKSVLQVGIYQNIVVLFNFFPAYLGLCADDPETFEAVLSRALQVAETFDMGYLHPGVFVGLYLAAAQGYLSQGDRGGALAMLERYTEIVTDNIYPLRLHGDGFFDRIEPWLDTLDLGTHLPRDEKTVRKSMADSIVHHPVFSALEGEPRFQRIKEKLQDNSK